MSMWVLCACANCHMKGCSTHVSSVGLFQNIMPVHWNPFVLFPICKFFYMILTFLKPISRQLSACVSPYQCTSVSPYQCTCVSQYQCTSVSQYQCTSVSTSAPASVSSIVIHPSMSSENQICIRTCRKNVAFHGVGVGQYRDFGTDMIQNYICLTEFLDCKGVQEFRWYPDFLGFLLLGIPWVIHFCGLFISHHYLMSLGRSFGLRKACIIEIREKIPSQQG